MSGSERECRLTPTAGQAPVANVNNTTGVRFGKDQTSFYLSDHLGNTRVTYSPTGFISNGNSSIAVSHLNNVMDYFPYGKVLREFQNGENERYLTTQHERDQETGLDYRGARYYDGDIGRFLSLDPHASKYPSLSDYCYVAGNPIIFTDPDGKDIIITNSYVDAESGERISFSVTYREGKLYDKSGTEYTAQSGGFMEQVQNELTELENSHKRMANVINRLEGSSETHEITNYHAKTRGFGRWKRPDLRYVGKPYTVQKGSVSAPNSSIIQYFGNGSPKDSKDEAAPSIVVLGHELIHAYDLDIGKFEWFKETRAGIKKSEIHAVKVENLVREYLGIPIRTSYQGVPIPELNK
ncbi:MAG: M91 family zinc metallopeptidase [Flavobacteriales bacterium]|nr:M91 family zinc metallopeptidase [Flavobacteriales bacterium]